MNRLTYAERHWLEQVEKLLMMPVSFVKPPVLGDYLSKACQLLFRLDDNRHKDDIAHLVAQKAPRGCVCCQHHHTKYCDDYLISTVDYDDAVGCEVTEHDRHRYEEIKKKEKNARTQQRI